MAKLFVNEKISRKDAHNMILDMARHTEWSDKFANKPDAEIKRFFKTHGLDYGREVEKTRIFSNNIIFLENLISDSSNFVVEEGSSIQLIDSVTRKESKPIIGPGVFSTAPYIGLFSNSYSLFKKSIEQSDYHLFLSSLSSGVSSIEAYINEWVGRFNEMNPDKQLTDNKQTKVSLDDKNDFWIPIINGGKKLDKGTVVWFNFKILRNIRDKEAIHVRAESFGISYSELSKYMNMYKTGIARMLFNLHIIFNQIVPSYIVRASYFPEVSVLDN